MGKRRGSGEGSVLKIKRGGKVASRFWYIQYYQNGKQVRVSSGTEVRQEALAMLRKQMGERDDGGVSISDVRKLRYADLREALIDSYINQGRKSLRTKSDGTESIAGLTALDEFCGYKTETVDGKLVVTEKGMPVTSLTTDAARRFARERKAEGVGNAAINRSLAALRRMLTIARRERKLTSVPYIEFLKEPPARKGFLERSDFERLVKLLPTHLRPLVTFLYWCGCRIGETLQIEWSQVDLDARQIRLEPEQTKTSEGRIIPLSSDLVDTLRQIEPKEGTVFDGTNLRKEWMKACHACGLGTTTEVEGRPYDPIYSGLTLHDLRRSAVRNLRKAGVSEREAMRISGHKTRAVFDRYNIVSTDDVMDAMRKLELAALNETRKPVQSEVSLSTKSNGETLGDTRSKRQRKSLMALSSRG
jgi:integrase